MSFRGSASGPPQRRASVSPFQLREPPLHFRQLATKVREARETGKLLEVLPQRARRRSPYGFATPYDLRSQHAATGAECGMGFNAGLIADAHLAADHSVI